MENIIIRGIELPPKIKGVTVIDDEGDYNVYINTLLSPEVQKRTQKHELAHIIKDHFYNYDPVVINEIEANAG
jgi:Zn-dependent peptidase ImmA (M78 family)